MPTLFDPLRVGDIDLATRIVMAPLTRSRASPGQLPNDNGYTRAMALEAVAGGAADLVAFGKSFIANPDLGRRLRENAPLAAWDTATFYGGGAAGYTDYPALDAALA